MKMNFDSKHDIDKIFIYVGWGLSSCIIFTGLYFLWPRIHITILGLALIYLGVRVFNFSTFDEYKEQRMKLLYKLFD